MKKIYKDVGRAKTKSRPLIRAQGKQFIGEKLLLEGG
jgi:hypothetical protein